MSWALLGVDHPGFRLGDEIGRQADDGSVAIDRNVSGRIIDHVLGGFYDTSFFTRDEMIDYNLCTAAGRSVCHLRVMNMNQQLKRFDLGYLLLRTIFIMDPEPADEAGRHVRAGLDLRRFGHAVQARYAIGQFAFRLYFDERQETCQNRVTANH